jgi:LPPG:FO 2-phospho-L-lactate transferase
MKSTTSGTKVTLLAGGVGAARLLRGLVDVVEPRDLTVVVNTGDDEEFYGLHVSPDIDTILYTLAGLAPPGRGWGIRGDTFRALGALERLYGPAWFRLGDRDLATHIFRTERLHAGWTLSRCVRELCATLGVKASVLPATDDRMRTQIDTPEGLLAFQDYLVRLRAKPRVQAIRYQGASRARPAPGVVDAIERADVVLIAPSNPFVSIGPILALRGARAALKKARARAVAISPLVGGRAVKGPLADMLRALGHRADATALAGLYRGLVSTLVVAPGDAPRVHMPGFPRIVEHDILIAKRSAARRLARFAIEVGAAA